MTDPVDPSTPERAARGLLLSHGACMEDYGLIGDASVIENGRTEYARLLDAYRGAILAARDTEWREAVLPRDKEWGRDARESLIVFATLAKRDRYGHMNDSELPELKRRINALIEDVRATTHPAPARGVTEEQAADVLFWMASAARNGKPLAPILTAALTPDAP